MVFPLAALGAASVIGGHAARIGITLAGVKGFSGQFVQSLPFGAGYSLGTYLGFPKNYQSKSSYGSTTQINLMPYGNYGGYYSRGRYSRKKKIRVWSRKYRRYVWVYPRRRY